MITIKNRKLIIPKEDRVIGTVSDNNSETRIFVIDRYIATGIDLAALTFGMDMVYEDGTTKNATYLTKEVTDDIINLTWGIVAGDVQKAGTMFVQITAFDYDGTVKWATIRDAFYVEPVIGTAEEYSGDLSAFQRMEAVLDQKLDKIEGFLEDIDDIEAAEELRVSAEEGRVSAEEGRVSAESGRVEAEAVRVQNERERQATMSELEEDIEAALQVKDDVEALKQSAAQSASNASTSETNAASSASSASDDALTASNAATSASADATLSKSWAEGGTGTREGEDTNNAKYWAEQAASHAGGRFVSYDAQTLTPAEQTQARTNIGAASSSDLSGKGDGLQLVGDRLSLMSGNTEIGHVNLPESGLSTIVEIPVPKSKNYTYNGNQQTFEWNSIDSEHIQLTNNIQQDAGIYTVTASLKNPADYWRNAGGTLDKADKTFTWEIAKATGDFTLSTDTVSALMTAADPTVNVSNIVGDGTISVSSSAVGVVNPSYSAYVITLTKVSAGTATVTVSLSATTNYTAQTKTIAVTLTKANQTFDLSASSVSLTSASPTATVNISNATGDGAFSVSSSNTGVATASVSGNVVSITGVATGSATITVTKAATTNYNALSKTINVAVSLNVIVTLTINGAKEDNITIKDSSNATKGTCVFASGQTSGTCQISIPPNGGSYTFISSVAKSLDGLGNNYTKSVTLTSSPTQTVNVYDSNALEWIGNKIKPFETKAVMVRTSYDSTSHPKAPIIQLSTNATAVTGVSDALGSTGGIYACTEQINFANYSKLKIEVISSTYGYLQNYRDVSIKCVNQITTSSASGVLANEYIAVTSNQQPPFPYAHTGIIEVDLSNISQTGFVVIDVYRDSSVATDPQPSIIYSRIWLEP